MKTLKLSVFALFVASLSFAQTKEAPKATPIAPAPAIAQPIQHKETGLKFDKETHDFGNLEKGKPATYDFTFTNTSKETILITNVRPSCGCTAANYTKTPIKPGEKGFVSATFNAASEGPFQKNITVMTNDTESGKSLTIKGKVEPTSAPAPATEIKS